MSIEQFCKIMYQIIKRQIVGTYNVSLSEKIYISEIIKWLDPNFFSKINFINKKIDSFTLSNDKLVKKIKLKPLKYDLKLFCEKLIK